MKNIEVGDVVKFVPYYASTGMQGSSLKLKIPEFSGLALVYKVYSVRGIGYAHIMLSNRDKEVIGFAGIEMLSRIN